MTKGFMKIHTKPLMESLGNKVSFVLGKNAIQISFDTKNSFATYNILRTRKGNKFPTTVAKKGSKFIRHGSPSSNIFKSLSNTCGFNSFRKRMSGGCLV